MNGILAPVLVVSSLLAGWVVCILLVILCASVQAAVPGALTDVKERNTLATTRATPLPTISTKGGGKPTSITGSQDDTVVELVGGGAANGHADT